MKGIRIGLRLAMTLAVLTPRPGIADETFFDTARVLASEPIYATIPATVPARECAVADGVYPPVKMDPALLGDARGAAPESGLVAALRADSRLRRQSAPPEPCLGPGPTHGRAEVIGYRVRYEYEGRVYERRMDESPGATIRVRVRISADGAATPSTIAFFRGADPVR